MAEISNCDQISRAFTSTVKLLRLSGACPIIITEKKTSELEQPGKFFSLKTPCVIGKAKRIMFYETYSQAWNRTITWGSYFLSAFFLFSCVNFICNVGLHIPFPFDLLRPSKNTLTGSYIFNSKICRCTIVATAALAAITHMNALINATLFAKWLNKWNNFEHDFSSTFGPDRFPFKFNGFGFNNSLLFFFVFLSNFLWAGFGLNSFLSYYEKNTSLYWLSLISTLGAGFLMFFSPQSEDLKSFLMLETLHITIEQVRNTITETGRTHQVHSRDVRDWKKLFCQIREQVELFSKHAKGRQLSSIFQTIFVVSTGIVLISDVIGRGMHSWAERSFVSMSIFFCAFSVLRVYISVVQAERIYSEERLLAEDLLEVHDETSDESVQSELKLFYTMLKMEPTLIKLGNYFELDKKLLVTIGIHTLTFLIAITQFGISMDSPAAAVSSSGPVIH